MDGDLRGAPALTFLSKGDNGRVAPGNTFHALHSPRASPLEAPKDSSTQDINVCTPRDFIRAVEASWALPLIPEGSTQQNFPEEQLPHDSGFVDLEANSLPKEFPQQLAANEVEILPAVTVHYEDSGCAEHEEDLEHLVTQATIDAVQPRKSLMRRPSVVQFAQMQEAAAAAAQEAAISSQDPVTKSRFQVAGKMAMAASHFQTTLYMNQASQRRSLSKKFRSGSSLGSQNSDVLPKSRPELTWKIKAKAGLAARVSARKTLLGEGAMMKGHSLGIFGTTNKYRLAVFETLYSQCFEYLLFCAIIIHLVAITSESGSQSHSTAVYVLDIFVLCFYLLEMFARIFALGFWRGETAYLRNNYNRLDFLVVISSCALKVVAWDNIYQPIYPGVFRAIRAVLCLRNSSGVLAIIATMECTSEALPQLKDVLLFTAMVALLFGLAGIQLFSGSFRRGCVLATGPGDSDWVQANPGWLCGTIIANGQPNPSHGKGYLCPAEQGQFCTSSLGDPNYGNTGFDNLGETALLMIQTLSYESWEFNMWNNIDAEHQYASIYYILFILAGPFVLINVFVAGISSVFLQLRRRNKILLVMSKKQKMKRLAQKQIMRSQSRRFRLEKQGSSQSNASGSYELIKSFVPNLTESFSVKQGLRDVFTRAIRVLPLGQTQDSVTRRQDSSFSKLSDSNASDSLVPHHPGAWHAHWMQERVKAARIIVSSPWFHYGTGILVLANFIVMCLYQPGDFSSRASTLHIIELTLAGIFLAECCFRIAAAGVQRYFGNAGELFDFAIVVVSLVALVSGKYPNLNMARVFRYIRALGRNERGRGTVVFTLLSSWASMLSLFSFLFIVIAMFAVFAMQLFGGHYNGFDDGKPRQNFDTFPKAWLTIFQVTSGDTWMAITWKAMRLQWSAALFFSACWLFTNIVVLNLVIALVLEQFRLKDNVKLGIQRKEVLKAAQQVHVAKNGLVALIESIRVRLLLLWNAQRWTKSRAAKHSPYFARLAEAERSAAKHKIAESDSEDEGKRNERKAFRRLEALGRGTSKSSFDSSLTRSESKAAEEMICLKLRDSITQAADTSKPLHNESEDNNMGLAEEFPRRPPVTSIVMKKEYGKQTQYRRASLVVLAALEDLDTASESQNAIFPAYMRDKSMGYFDKEHRARQVSALVTSSYWYRWLSMGVIVISVIAVIWTPNSSSKGPDSKRHIVRAMNYLVALFFAMDAVMKMIAQGVLLTPTAYFQNAWNCLDMFILLIDLLRLKTYSGYKQRVLLALTSFRGFRVMTRQQAIQNLITALLKTLGPIFTVFLLAFSLFVIFAILAVRLFGDRLYSCNDSSILTGREDCFGNFVALDSGIYMPRVWDRPDYNFDSLGKAILTLFELGTLDNWGDAMFAAMDITGVDRQPRQNAQWQNAVFFIVFVCVSAHFMIKSFIAVFCEQFDTITGTALLTDRQKTWRNITKQALSLKPIRLERVPSKPFRAKCFYFIHSKYFRWAILAIILIDMGFLASYHYNQSPTWTTVLNSIDAGFTALFVLEVLLKWQAAGSLWRWCTYWNVGEAILAIGSIATVFPAPGSTRASVSRPFGFIRILRVIRYVQGLRLVGGTLRLAGSAMITILTTIGIVIFAYAGIGVQIFASVKYRLNLDRQVNFRSFSNSFLFLFQVLTGENWRYTMDDIKQEAPYCTQFPPGSAVSDCGLSGGATIFFVTFVILNSYLLSNLFVAAIMEIVVSGLLREGAVVTSQDLETFQRLWACFDPFRQGYIGLHNWKRFLSALKTAKSPLASKASYLAWARPICYEAWHCHSPKKGIMFTDAILILLHDKLGRHALTYDVRRERDRERKEFMQGGAAAIIQAHVRGYLTRVRVARIKARHANRLRRQKRDDSKSPHWKLRKVFPLDAPSASSAESASQLNLTKAWLASPSSQERRESLQRKAKIEQASSSKDWGFVIKHPAVASQPQQWPQPLAEPGEPEESPYEVGHSSLLVNGRSVLGTLELGDGLAPSGLMSGQPRRRSPRLGSPRKSGLYSDSGVYGVDCAMSFRLPPWGRPSMDDIDSQPQPEVQYEDSSDMEQPSCSHDATEGLAGSRSEICEEAFHTDVTAGVAHCLSSCSRSITVETL